MTRSLAFVATLVLVPLAAIGQQAPSGAITFSDESPTNDLQPSLPQVFIPLLALPGTEVVLNLEYAISPDGVFTVRETRSEIVPPNTVMRDDEEYLLIIDYVRATYATMRLAGSIEADFPRAQVFVRRSGKEISDELLRARLLSGYARRLESDAAAWRDAAPQSRLDRDDVVVGTAHRRLCDMTVAYAIETIEPARLTVAETFSRIDASSNGLWRHSGWCVGTRPVQVRIPGSSIVLFETNWHSRCARRSDQSGGTVRTGARGNFVNNDFPPLRIFNRMYPDQNVYVVHEILMNVNAGSGALHLRTSYSHTGDGNPSILASYLLMTRESHFRRVRHCL